MAKKSKGPSMSEALELAGITNELLAAVLVELTKSKDEKIRLAAAKQVMELRGIATETKPQTNVTVNLPTLMIKGFTTKKIRALREGSMGEVSFEQEQVSNLDEGDAKQDREAEPQAG